MARQITYVPNEGHTIWLGIEGRQSPKSDWGPMLRLSEKLKEHGKIDDDPESKTKGEMLMAVLHDGTAFPVFEGPLVLSLERDELNFVLAACAWYEERGAGASLAKTVKAIRSKTEAVLAKMDAKANKKKAG